jgi:hypothetical protein
MTGFKIFLMILVEVVLVLDLSNSWMLLCTSSIEHPPAETIHSSRKADFLFLVDRVSLYSKTAFQNADDIGL